MKYTVQELQKKIQDEKKKYFEEAKRLYAELREEKKKIHCSKCKYCITNDWRGHLVCAKPKKNRKKCFSYDELGTEIYAKNIFEKALRCENYSPDGKEDRGFEELETEIKEFWIEAHKKSIIEWRGEYTEKDIKVFLNHNKRMIEHDATKQPPIDKPN